METCRSSSRTLSSVPSKRARRSVRFRTALREKLKTSSCPGESPVRTRPAIRTAAISVLPVPGPASTSNRAPAPALRMSSRCSSSSGRVIPDVTQYRTAAPHATNRPAMSHKLFSFRVFDQEDLTCEPTPRRSAVCGLRPGWHLRSVDCTLHRCRAPTNQRVSLAEPAAICMAAGYLVALWVES